MNMRIPLKGVSVILSAVLTYSGFNGISTAEPTLDNADLMRSVRSPIGGRLKSQIMIQVYH